MNKKVKVTLKCLAALVFTLIIIVAGYVSYVFISYSRIDDMQALEVRNKGLSEEIRTGEKYTAFINNIGFGAYTQDFTFFMDGGTSSRAESAESVQRCIALAGDKAEEFSPDFIMLQEVDFDSTRSFHIDQQKILEDRFSEYSSVFAVNYDSAYLMYPFNSPHGASKAGILTLSKTDISSAVRRSLPISESVTKLLDLDRCYSKARVSVENGKELVLYNVHLSAYGGSDEIRAAQMNMLFSDIKDEYDKGNYCVTGGDFNHDFTGDSTQKLNGGMSVDFGWAQPFPVDMLPDCIVRADDYSHEEAIPTCRNCDVPYEKGNFTIIVDGFLVTKNVNIVSVSNISTDFVYSDHNPVVLEFELI